MGMGGFQTAQHFHVKQYRDRVAVAQDDEVVVMIKELLETRIRCAVAVHPPCTWTADGPDEKPPWTWRVLTLPSGWAGIVRDRDLAVHPRSRDQPQPRFDDGLLHPARPPAEPAEVRRAGVLRPMHV